MKLRTKTMEELKTLLFGVSMELSACLSEPDMEPEPGEEFATREELERDMTAIQSEIRRRQNTLQ